MQKLWLRSSMKWLSLRVIDLCMLLEKACIRYGDPDTSLELPSHLCRYRVQ
ncbi:hypothetical protein L208DRAFT_1414816, partial [Tricholoma matsutake]